jgi:hypothetical protein
LTAISNETSKREILSFTFSFTFSSFMDFPKVYAPSEFESSLAEMWEKK